MLGSTMMKLCIFDMGGVMVRDFRVWPRLLAFLGYGEGERPGQRFYEAVRAYELGACDEDAVWERYTALTGKALPPHEGSLFGAFFTPRPDEPTVCVIKALKEQGLRVVCGTNTIAAHYRIHEQLGQYAHFDRVYSSHALHLAKPDPAFFRYILAAEGASPGEAFFTDDMAENVDAAVKLGIAGRIYTDADALRAQLRDITPEIA
jgi:putative hydrolase of the HAD superfamily